jgi:hypothetical protein
MKHKTSTEETAFTTMWAIVSVSVVIVAVIFCYLFVGFPF